MPSIKYGISLPGRAGRGRCVLHRSPTQAGTVQNYAVCYPTGPAEEGGSRPVSRVLSRATIHLGRASPHASSDLPESGADHTLGFLFGLAPGGVYPAVRVTTNAVRSYRTFSPLPTRHPKVQAGGLFSVALSVDSRRPDIIWHPALWSPDFPRSCPVSQRIRWRQKHGPRSPGRLPPYQHRPTGARIQDSYSVLITFQLLQHQTIKIIFFAASNTGCGHTGNTRWQVFTQYCHQLPWINRMLVA